jgi:hypothetical protein
MLDYAPRPVDIDEALSIEVGSLVLRVFHTC